MIFRWFKAILVTKFLLTHNTRGLIDIDAVRIETREYVFGFYDWTNWTILSLLFFIWILVFEIDCLRSVLIIAIIYGGLPKAGRWISIDRDKFLIWMTLFFLEHQIGAKRRETIFTSFIWMLKLGIYICNFWHASLDSSLSLIIFQNLKHIYLLFIFSLEFILFIEIWRTLFC